jgi:hypothetical protein
MTAEIKDLVPPEPILRVYTHDKSIRDWWIEPMLGTDDIDIAPMYRLFYPIEGTQYHRTAPIIGMKLSEHANDAGETHDVACVDIYTHSYSTGIYGTYVVEIQDQVQRDSTATYLNRIPAYSSRESCINHHICNVLCRKTNTFMLPTTNVIDGTDFFYAGIDEENWKKIHGDGVRGIRSYRYSENKI